MQIRVHYQGFEHSPWMDQLITSRVSKLDRYLGFTATIHVHLTNHGDCFQTIISVHNGRKDFTFTAEGYNLYEAFSLAMDLATKSLSDYKRKLRDRIHRRFVA